MLAMDLLHPRYEAEVDIASLYGDADRGRPDRPYVLANMVASTDGATALDGRSGGLGNETDRQLFLQLRHVADVLLVGATTVRAEHYRPSRVPGQRIAVVTRSCDLDLGSELFTSGRGIIVTTLDSDPMPENIPTIRVGQGTVIWDEALHALQDLGASTVLCEGGPGVVHQLIGAGLLDELCLTLSPWLVGGSSNRVGGGAGPAHVASLRLAHLGIDGDHLFLRYVTN
jgi:riboflavin biosynthesis pyrimidine reductase